MNKQLRNYILKLMNEIVIIVKLSFNLFVP